MLDALTRRRQWSFPLCPWNFLPQPGPQQRLCSGGSSSDTGTVTSNVCFGTASKNASTIWLLAAGGGLASKEEGRLSVAGKAVACGTGEGAAAAGWLSSSGAWKRQFFCGVAAWTSAKGYLCSSSFTGPLRIKTFISFALHSSTLQ